MYGSLDDGWSTIVIQECVCGSMLLVPLIMQCDSYDGAMVRHGHRHDLEQPNA